MASNGVQLLSNPHACGNVCCFISACGYLLVLVQGYGFIYSTAIVQKEHSAVSAMLAGENLDAGTRQQPCLNQIPISLISLGTDGRTDSRMCYSYTTCSYSYTTTTAIQPTAKTIEPLTTDRLTDG